MKVSFAPAAKADLIEIAIYIAQDNPDRHCTGAADRYRTAASGAKGGVQDESRASCSQIATL